MISEIELHAIQVSEIELNAIQFTRIARVAQILGCLTGIEPDQWQVQNQNYPMDSDSSGFGSYLLSGMMTMKWERENVLPTDADDYDQGQVK